MLQDLEWACINAWTRTESMKCMDSVVSGYDRHDVPEEVEFMDKVRMYYEVAEHLAETEAMALLGVHMLRNGVEPDLRLELLEEIINELPDGDAARNGAILVAIETLHELGEEEEAARLHG